MKLGRACQITIGSTNVRESYEFYRLLGFRKLAEDRRPFPWIKITDGSIVLLLYQNGDNYLGLTYFDRDMDKIVSQLSDEGIKFVQRGTRENIFITPTDTIVVLVKADHEAMFVPQNKMLLDLTEADYGIPERYPNPALGIFGEFSHPVADLKEAITCWQKLGYKLHHQTMEPYPWALMYDGQMILGFHETNDFDHLALSYFSPEVIARVEQFSEKGIYTTEYTGTGGSPENVVIRTPENQRIFLFQA
ncbi:MAG: hypothetical protein V4616_11120 [Bacteroidota bacterium]